MDCSSGNLSSFSYVDIILHFLKVSAIGQICDLRHLKEEGRRKKEEGRGKNLSD
ncbi:MAG: hypothetical protein HC894_29760 [Microcoleus sp. SM1_3_4]|nr:hypothetical protein [Microcoleus sp. SM1_3_4]